jgi:long-chain acyl-CoA synthetase
MIQLLLRAPLEQFDLSTLRYLNCGAAPLSVEVLREFERRVPGVEICEGYGCTESGAVVSVNRGGQGRPGSVGRPIPGYEVRIAGDSGDEVPVGEVGEVWCRSPGVMQGYWKEPELTADTIRHGWLRTGDMGRLDGDGYLWIIDRKKDLIIRGGFNVFPRDVEDSLLQHPAVEVAGVIGRPDDVHGEEVVAFVSLRAGVAAKPSPDELIAFARERLGGHTYPREVRIVPSVPMTPVGKVDRKALRASLNVPGA